MDDIAIPIATGHKTTTIRSYVIKIGWCNRSADTAKLVFEKYQSSNGTANTHSLYTSNENIEHGNTHRFTTYNGVHTSGDSVSDHISNTEDLNQNWISPKTNSRNLFPYFRGNNYISPVKKLKKSSND